MLLHPLWEQGWETRGGVHLRAAVSHGCSQTRACRGLLLLSHSPSPAPTGAFGMFTHFVRAHGELLHLRQHPSQSDGGWAKTCQELLHLLVLLRDLRQKSSALPLSFRTAAGGRRWRKEHRPWCKDPIRSWAASEILPSISNAWDVLLDAGCVGVIHTLL